MVIPIAKAVTLIPVTMNTMIPNHWSRPQVLQVTHFLNNPIIQRRFQAFIPAGPLVCQGLLESPRVICSFIRYFETYISERIDLTLLLHYLISACEGEPADSIGHYVLLGPKQGYT